MAIVPTAPSFADRFDLSKVQVGALLASAGLATLLISLPIGLVSDRLGTRRLIRASAAVVAVSTLGQGLAFDFWSLLAARAPSGSVSARSGPQGWRGSRTRARTPEPVRPRRAGRDRRRRHHGRCPPCRACSPTSFGLRAPFLMLAVAAAVVFVALLRGARMTRATVTSRCWRLWQGPRGSRRPRQLGLIGRSAVGGGVNLLVPLGLRRRATRQETRGSSSRLVDVFVVVSLVVTRLGRGRSRCGSPGWRRCSTQP